jgi:hypothetical protein
MTPNPDRLYELLPVVYRLRDADRGYPLRALTQVIAEQVDIVEADIAQLYENWFIETCQEWVVPYIGSLIGYNPVTDTTELADIQNPRGLSQERILIPRREVANTIHYRRRKGTLSLLEDLAMAVAGWPAHAFEFYRLLGVTQNINYRHLDRGQTVDVRDGDALENIDGPFDELAHTVDVRRVNSHRGKGKMNIPEVGVFVWRLKTYPVTQTPAYCYEEESPNCYLFSVLGNDTQLYTNPQPPPVSLGYSANELNYPTPIRRRNLVSVETDEPQEIIAPGIPFYYGDGKSFEIRVGASRQLFPPAKIYPADLSSWTYRPLPDTVAVDPQLGRIVFPPGQSRKQGVWVSYYYAFSAGIGGGEYNRALSQPSDSVIYLVGYQETFTRINDALTKWGTDKPKNAVIEITDSGVYVEQISISLGTGRVRLSGSWIGRHRNRMT